MRRQKIRDLRKIILVVLLFGSLASFAQSNDEKLANTLKAFHQALVDNNTVSINQQTDKALSYGHSNGWLETKNEMISHLQTGYIDYHSYKEDSLNIVVNDNLANARFVADVNVTLNGNTVNYHLKVLEVWVKKGKRWLLFARQAVR